MRYVTNQELQRRAREAGGVDSLDDGARSMVISYWRKLAVMYAMVIMAGGLAIAGAYGWAVALVLPALLFMIQLQAEVIRGDMMEAEFNFRAQFEDLRKEARRQRRLLGRIESRLRRFENGGDD